MAVLDKNQMITAVVWMNPMGPRVSAQISWPDFSVLPDVQGWKQNSV